MQLTPKTLGLPLLVTAVFGLAAVSGSALAQAYPSKPVQMLVPYPAGGPADVMARTLSERLSAQLKQTFIVVNQPGAGGNLGGKAAAQAQPDGHTILLTLDAALAANPALYGARMGFEPQKDLRPVTTLVSFGQTLAVHPSLQISNVAQFVELARRKDATYASAGNGSTGHLGMELLASQTQAKLTHIPYKGAAPALNDMVGGQVDAGFLVTPGVAPYAKAGKLIPLAVSSRERSKLLPQVPTVTEAGLPGATLEFSIVLLVPAKTPDTIVRTLEEETRKALSSPQMLKLLTDNDYTLVNDTSEQAASRLQATAKRLTDLIRSVGIKAD
ncbi:Bug family tripartite tricarboxylate transporter substrate binding protein [Piscinibacter sp.]|uniref:Bug family tripartite tricarboxylate transporter substrate binding protein n=1 Tax=Piscinibacter sp. TaxID=1903157 RepID=UPI002C3535C0|nr:tripartite tricarboxylate transporter substrate binding protein [Albitalea sp.]HUG26297.1 tripartite tricarboxylate transporter substrate binding protein [Albitalea sp.]